MSRQTTIDPAGFVYLVVHPRFPGWVKVGSAMNPTKRLGSYQTGDPDRGYRMIFAIPTANRRHTEWLTHRRLKRLGYDHQGEWFEVGVPTAQKALLRAVKESEQA